MNETAEPPATDQDEVGGWTSPLIRGHRSVTDRYIAGVLGGLGERFDIDPLILRVIAVAAAVSLRDAAPPLVPVLYTIGWIIIPPQGERSLLATANQRRSLREIGGAAIGAALAAFVATTPALWIAATLAAIAWLLLADRDPAGAPDQLPPDATTEALDVGPPTSHEASQVQPDADTAAQWGRTRRGIAEPLRALRLRPVRERRPKREPALWPLTLGLLVALAVTCMAIDHYRDPGLDPAIAVNGALIIIGGVLALSAWRGRAGWPTLLALALIPLWIAFSATGIGRFDGSGSRWVHVLDRPDEGRLAIEHGYGDLDIVISEDALPQGTTLHLKTEMTAGTTTIAVPDITPITIRSRAGIGHVAVDGAGSAWNTDRAAVVNHSRTRTYSAVADECYTEDFSLSRVEGIYRDWVQSAGPGESPSDRFPNPDFTDPATAEMPGMQGFRSWLGLNLTPDQRASGLVWTSSLDYTGQPCDPDEPLVETGAIEIDATIGLGEIHVVRSH
ncbi:MAG: PspC domain-containing protein [Actinomycetia bacterium]|nr:PspC domain-containing protein [Actinomycetes bacterium]